MRASPLRLMFLACCAAALLAAPRAQATGFTEIDLAASDGAMRQMFAMGVAGTADWVAAGAPQDDRWCCRLGAVYAYDRPGWAEHVLRPPDLVYGEFFGQALAASGDTLLVGAYADASAGPWRAGAAYVFVRAPDGGWTQQAKLTAADPQASAFFGIAVALDGDTALIGASNADGGTGKAYVFVRQDGAWTQQAVLAAPAPGVYAATSVAVRGDTAALGALYGGPAGQGSLLVYERAGGAWTQTAELTAAAASGGDGLGYCVALSEDVIVGGAAYAGGTAGAAYAFARTPAGWVEEAQLAPPTADPGDYYGMRCAIDGGLAAVSSPFRQGSTGAVHLFRRGPAGWGAPVTLTAAAPSPAAFGSALDLAGTTVLVGAYAWPGRGDPAEFTGRAYVFEPLNTPPTVACASPAATECASAAGAAVALSAQVADADGEALQVTWSIDGVPVQVDAVPASGPPSEATLILTPTLAVGPHTAAVAASDGTASAACQVAVEVVDTTPPQVACPAAPTLDATSASGAVASYGAASAADACGAAAVACWPASGSTLPFGVTWVTCTALDPAGLTSTCAFPATVLTPWQVLEAAQAELAALGDAHGPLGVATAQVTAALDLARWSDPLRLRPRGGEVVLARLGAAALTLRAAAYHPPPGVTPGELTTLAERLAGAARVLTLVALQDAAGGDPRALARAQDAIAQGEEVLAAGYPALAIERFADAWRHALRA